MDLDSKIDRILEGDVVWVKDFKSRFDHIDGRINSLEIDHVKTADRVSGLEGRMNRKKGLRVGELIDMIVNLPALVHLLIVAVPSLLGVLWLIVKRYE